MGMSKVLMNKEILVEGKQINKRLQHHKLISKTKLIQKLPVVPSLNDSCQMIYY